MRGPLVGPIKTKAKSLGNGIRLLNPGNMEKSIVSYHSGHMSPLAPASSVSAFCSLVSVLACQSRDLIGTHKRLGKSRIAVIQGCTGLHHAEKGGSEGERRREARNPAPAGLFSSCSINCESNGTLLPVFPPLSPGLGNHQVVGFVAKWLSAYLLITG